MPEGLVKLGPFDGYNGCKMSSFFCLLLHWSTGAYYFRKTTPESAGKLGISRLYSLWFAGRSSYVYFVNAASCRWVRPLCCCKELWCDLAVGFSKIGGRPEATCWGLKNSARP